MVRFIRDRRRCLADVGLALVVGAAGAFNVNPTGSVGVAMIGVVLVLVAGQ